MVYSRRGRRAVASLIDARRDRGCVPETRPDQIRSDIGLLIVDKRNSTIHSRMIHAIM